MVLSCLHHVFNKIFHYPPPTIGVPPTPGVGPSGAGWPGQNTRFLHTTHTLHWYYYQSRSVHDTVVARLTPEDIKKAREAKQAMVKPVRQKVGRSNKSNKWSEGCFK